jgi:hypothetical protein
MPEWSLYNTDQFYNSDHFFPVAQPGSKATRKEPSSSFSFSPLIRLRCGEVAALERPWRMPPLSDAIDIDQTPSTKLRFQRQLRHLRRS